MEAVFLSRAEQVARWKLVEQHLIFNFSKKVAKWSVMTAGNEFSLMQVSKSNSSSVPESALGRNKYGCSRTGLFKFQNLGVRSKYESYKVKMFRFQEAGNKQRSSR